MNTSEYHSKETYTRCHTCVWCDAPHCAIGESLGATIKPDTAQCDNYAEIHSGHLHDQTDVAKDMYNIDIN